MSVIKWKCRKAWVVRRTHETQRERNKAGISRQTTDYVRKTVGKSSHWTIFKEAIFVLHPKAWHICIFVCVYKYMCI